MKRFAFPRGVVCLLAGLLLPGSLLPAAEKVEFKMSVQTGDHWAFESQMDMRQSIQMANPNLPQPMQMQQTMRVLRKGNAEVLAAGNGVPTSIRVAFAKDCLSSMEMAGQPKQEMPWPLAGQTVTITRQADGTVQHDFKGQLDPQSEQDLKKMLDPDTSFYPEKPVEVGESWHPTKEAIAKVMPLSPQDKADVTCTLSSIKELNGRRVAEVAVKFTITQSPQPNMQVTMDFSGNSLVDLDSGMTMKADLDGKTKMAGQQQMQDPNTGQAVAIQVSGDGTAAFRSQATPQGAGRATREPERPVDVGRAVPGPERPEAPRGSFAGIFKDQNLTIDLKESGGRYTGTITLGDQKFDCTAQEADGQLKGTFASGNDSFPFTASLAGDSMKLTSGQTTYTLQRPAANPLAKPPAKNPLSPSGRATPATRSPAGGSVASRRLPPSSLLPAVDPAAAT